METEIMNQVLQTTDRLALSTSLANLADVKIVNFVWDPEQPGVLYFSSVQNSAATAVYDQHPDAAIITIPHDGTPGNPFVRSHHVQIVKSTKTMADLLPRYLETVSGYQAMWDAIGPTLVVYEIHMPSAVVDPGLGAVKKTLNFKN